MRTITVLLASLVVILSPPIAVFGTADDAPPCAVVPRDLRCDYLTDPQGIDDLHPRLSWKLVPVSPSDHGQSQLAYQVIVSSDRSLLRQGKGDLWDSGRVESSQSIHVKYAGQELVSCASCWWQVRVWDQADHVSTWSEPAHWSMGLLTDYDWDGAAVDWAG